MLGKFPSFTEPLEGFHGLQRGVQTSAFIVKLRMEILHDLRVSSLVHRHRYQLEVGHRSMAIAASSEENASRVTVVEKAEQSSVQDPQPRCPGARQRPYLQHVTLFLHFLLHPPHPP